MKTSYVSVVGRGDIRIEEREVPPLDPRDALLRIEMAGICGTDVHMVYDEHPILDTDNPYPFSLGHEFVGRVAALGRDFPGVDAFGDSIQEGDSIVVYPSTWACGRCYACKVLLAPNNCLRPAFARSLPQMGAGFAQYFYIPEGSTVFRIPADMAPEVAVLIEPLAGASRALERAYRSGNPDRGEGFGPGKSIVIQGAGTIGALLTILARLTGADHITVIGAPESRLRICRDFGADETIDLTRYPDHAERASLVRQRSPFGLGADVVIEAAGVPQALGEALDLVRPGGAIVEFGAYTNRGSAPINPSLICRKDVHILGSHGYGPQQFGTVLRLLRAYQSRVPFARLVTHRLPLTHIAEALDLARTLDCMKAVVLPQ